MQQFDTINALRAQRQAWLHANETLAFVPTMGNLHEGHLALVKAAKAQADRVLVSIFINPLQFGAHEDLDRYPRTLDADLAKLAQLGVDAVFIPAVAEVYPRGLAAQTLVIVPELSHILCGATRPGHFEGVATVVSKLFHIVQPDLAVFGQKDYQQLQVIRLMVADLCMPIHILGVETKREASGLALSSRNNYLTAAEHEQAAIIYQSLQQIAQTLQQTPNYDPASTETLLTNACDNWRAAGLTPDYLTVRRQGDLQAITAQDTDLVILAAAYLGSTRLIDNIRFSL